MSSNKAPKTAHKRQLYDDVADDHHEGNAHKRQRCFQRHKSEHVRLPELSNGDYDLAKSPVDDKRPTVLAWKSTVPITSDESSAAWALLALANFASHDLAKSPADDKRSNVIAWKSAGPITSDESFAAWALLALANIASRNLAKSPADDNRSNVRAGKYSAILTLDESAAAGALLALAKSKSRDLGDKSTSHSFSKYTFFTIIY